MGTINNKAFESKRKKQLNKLSKQIPNSVWLNSKQFHVFSIEASLGKTYTMIETINRIKPRSKKRKILIVTKFIDEGFIIQEKVQEAIAINSQNKIDEEELIKYDVVVITHQLYKILCKDYVRRRNYIEGRCTLIIDEELNLLNMAVLDDNEISEMGIILNELSTRLESDKVYLDCSLQETYYKIISELEEIKNKYIKKKMEFFFCPDEEANKKVDLLKQLVEDTNITNEYFHYLEDTYKIKTSKASIVSRIDVLRKFFNNKKVIASSKKLYTFDDSIEYFKLRNNILLDASSKFYEMYNISPLFKLHDTERIVDHSNTTIHICEQNTTSYSKRHTDGLYENIFLTILSKLKKDDKALVLCTNRDIELFKNKFKNEIYKLEDKEITLSMENFQAMRGKNCWKDYNKCFIVHNPQIGFPYYVFMYMYYGIKLPELTTEDLSIGKVGRNNGFNNNQIIEKLRKTDIVSNIYQGIKRINRSNIKKADIYIMNSDKEIIDMVIEQLRNVKVDKFDLIMPKKTKTRKKREQNGYNNDKRELVAKEKLKENAMKIKKYFEDLTAGEYKKIDARSETDIKNRKSFNKALDWLKDNLCKLESIGIKWEKTSNTFSKETIECETIDEEKAS